MNRNAVLALSAVAAVAAAVLLFPKGDIDIDVPEAERVEVEPVEHIEHVDDGEPVAAAGSTSRSEDDGSYRDGRETEEDKPFLSPAAQAANARRAAPFPMWSNQARPAWRAIDYRLRQLGDMETGAIALDVVSALVEVRDQVEPDTTALIQLQKDAVGKLRASPQAGEIEHLLERVEALIDELENLPPANLDENGVPTNTAQ